MKYLHNLPPPVAGVDLDAVEQQSHKESVVTVPLADGWEWLVMYAPGDGSEDCRQRGFPKYHHIHRRIVAHGKNAKKVAESRHYERPSQGGAG